MSDLRVEARLQAAVPRVTLRQATPGPYAGAIAAARTCYSPRVVGAEEVTPSQRESIGPLTFDAGHHTVYQHAHFEFGLEGVSRQFVWSFLHSHPFYNSEQSSQRFVRLDEISAHVPEGLTVEARAVFEQAIIDAWQAYRDITQLLRPETERLVGELRHLSPRASEARRRRIVREAEKKAIEVARYALPVAATTSMVHTISGIVLHRLYRMLHTGDTPRENTRVVEAMVEAVRAVDAELFERIGRGPIPAEETVELRIPRAAGAAQATATRLEERLGGRVSVLVDWPAHAETTVADAVRAVVGSDLDDDEALRWLLDPARNRYRLETLQTTMHSPVGRALHHATYTFLKRLSHTADSQDQRHRMVPASRPLTTLTDTVRPDYVVPALVRERPQILELFVRAMETAWAAKNLLLDMGVPAEQALYVLPNARALRFYETGSLLYLIHKWVQRTCLNAQEEIYQASMEELGQVRAVHPRLAQFVGPPCVLRAGRATPICTEGLHFCGIPVWRTFPDVQRIL